MPHARAPRSLRGSNPSVAPLAFRRRGKRGGTRAARLTGRPSEPRQAPVLSVEGSRNELGSLNEQARLEILQTIRQRKEQAQSTTDEISIKIDNWEKQYEGQWQDQEHDEEEHIYVGKTREMTQIVLAFMIMLLSQLPQLVSARPQVSSVDALDSEWRRAKVAEALLLYYFDDVWRFRDDVMPRWLKCFLKYSLAVMKVTWRTDKFEPDLRFDVVDRAFLYIDPWAHDLKTARWVLEVCYITRAEAQQMFDQGHWSAPADFSLDDVAPLGPEMTGTLARYFGKEAASSVTSVREDEQIEVWHYWQSPVKGLDDVYAVTLDTGTQLVRYGGNPFPYKGHPFRGKSYDPHEWRVDGNGLVELYRSVQEVLNTLFNLRLDDVRANIHSPIGTTGRLVDDTTVEDFKNRNKMVRFNSEAVDAVRQMSPNFKLADEFAELPVRTSTDGIFNDMGFLLQQGKELVNIGDAFRGQMPQKEATLGEVQETLTRNMGVFRPIWLQVMKLVEEVAEIALAYFRDAEFFGTSRIISVVGANKYRDTVVDWQAVSDDARARQVTADEMDLDLTVNAISGADQFMARTIVATSIQNFFGAIGQVPGAFEEIKDEYDWAALVAKAFNTSGLDIDEIRRSPEDVIKLKKERQQQQQAAQQQALQTQAAVEQATQNARAQAEAAIAQTKGAVQQQNIEAEHKADLESILTKVAAENKASMSEAMQAHRMAMERMFAEFKLELAAAVQGQKVSVGAGANRLNQ